MSHFPHRLPRREVLRLFAATALLPTALPAFGQEQEPKNTTPPSIGYGTDPNLVKDYKPGDVWPLILNEEQRKIVMAFADIILPADHLGPSATSLRVHDYIDEWISAPYPSQQASKPVILNGLVWLDAEAHKRHQKSFASLSVELQEKICLSIAEPDAKNLEHQQQHGFFRSFRAIAMGAYYSNPAGWKAVGYIGNVPSVNFDVQSEDLLKRLDLEQTVK